MKIENEKPRRYYAKHMVQGVAGYKDFNLYASNEAILKMEKSFEGKPLLVDHQDVDHDNLKNQMDGVVVKSFYNKWDGWHWCELVAITDKAVEAIEKKSWKVSNCYSPRVLDTKGTYLNIAYDQVLESGEYDHLALVSNPRYEDSVVLTPAEFKAYNEGKEAQFISNSKVKKSKGKRKMFEFFKKVKVENDINPEELIVKLENGKEISVAEAIKRISNEVEFDILDKTVLVNETEVMSVSELITSYEELLANAMKDEDEELENKYDSEDEEEDVENEDEEEDKENEEDEVDLENSVFQNHLDLINSLDMDKTVVMTDIERVKLGKLKY